MRRSSIFSKTSASCTGSALRSPKAVEGGKVAFETKAKSQKVANLRRNPLVTVMVEAGATYDQLRGVSIEGEAEIIDGGDQLWDIGVSVFERYQGVYSEEMRGAVEFMLNKRVGVVVHPVRVRSWEHRNRPWVRGLGPSRRHRPAWAAEWTG